MAITLDAVSTKGETTVSTSVSVTHTVAGADVYALAIVVYRSSSNQAINRSCSFGGNTMSELVYRMKGGSQTLRQISIFGLINPPQGSSTVTASWTNNMRRSIGVITFNGVDQSTPYQGSPGYAEGNSSAPSKIETTEYGQVVVDGLVETNGTETAGAGQTENWGGLTGYGTYNSSSYEAAAGASTTMSWTLGAATDWVLATVVLRPSASSRTRLTKYFFNTFDPNRRILDLQGRNVPVSQVGIDAWIRSDGPFMISPAKRTTLIEEPAMGYAENTRLSGDKLSVDTVRETMLESLLRRLGARGA